LVEKEIISWPLTSVCAIVIIEEATGPQPFLSGYRTRQAVTARKEEMAMAKTEKGKKIVPIKPYTKKVNGEKVKVKRHRRSTPN
jgi:hypothetical protein